MRCQILVKRIQKNNEYKRSIEIYKEYDIFRQCYCSCVFVANQQGIDIVCKAIPNNQENDLKNFCLM
ncbi:hypothetical protein GNP94_23960 [Paenibacillus campinasensis]|uniref:Queuosine biosynthesis protein QueH n=1 Tax=Paenibacillus campinasensis TaxID=66347 RepID=A0ABW9T8F1_9BACL|nr:hypothetical protein [Paenibacillus campinasensis]